MDTTNDTQVLSNFGARLRQEVSEIGRQESDQIIAWLKRHADSIVAQVDGIIADCVTREDYMAQIIKLDWPEHIKDYVVLLRDVAFNVVKAEHVAGSGAEQKVWQASQHMIKTALEEVIAYPSDRAAHLSSRSKELSQHEAYWSIQEPSWPLYKKQLEGLVEQIEKLSFDGDMLGKATHALRTIKETLVHYIEHADQHLDFNTKVVASARKSTKEHIADDKLNRIVHDLDKMGPSQDFHNSFGDMDMEHELTLKPVAKGYSYPIATEDGQIIVKDSHLRDDLMSWMESEIYPLIYEIDDIAQRSDNDVRVAINNVKNKAGLIAKRKDQEEAAAKTEMSEFSSAFEQYQSNAENNKQDLNKLSELLHQRIGNRLDPSTFFDPHANPFDVSFEESLRHLTVKQNKFLTKAQDWLKSKFGLLDDFYNSIADESSLSTFEKVDRYFDFAAGSDRSKEYANIFLTKGYIGKSFVVGRDSELRRIRNCYDNWLGGNRGTVLLSGHRHSGRTLMGDLAANELFQKKVVTLVPGLEYTVAGRTKEASYNLGKELGRVVKYGLRENLCVWIDNVEIWHDEKISLLQNVKALVKAMDSHGDKLFFIISSTHWTHNWLDRQLSWKTAFQLRLNLDKLDKDELAEAISIRHGATHKTLVDDEGQRLSKYQMRRASDKIYNRSRGIIGEALLHWANTIHDAGKGFVVQEVAKQQHLPQIVDKETGPVLQTLIRYRKINEKQMIQILGKSFGSKHRPLVQRFLQMGLFRRKLDGRLAIHSLSANEIVNQLHNDHWLNQNFE